MLMLSQGLRGAGSSFGIITAYTMQVRFPSQIYGVRDWTSEIDTDFRSTFSTNDFRLQVDAERKTGKGSTRSLSILLAHESAVDYWLRFECFSGWQWPATVYLDRRLPRTAEPIQQRRSTLSELHEGHSTAVCW